MALSTPEAVIMPGFRWLLVAQDGWGLGHVSRQLGIAREIRRQRPGDDILLLTQSEAAHLIWREGFPSLKLPSHAMWAKAGTRDRHLSPEGHNRLVTSIVRACVQGFGPHAIVIDTFPAGTHQELAELLDFPARRFLIARENRLLFQPAAQQALRRFDLILAPYRRGEVELPLPVEVPAQWVGPIMIRSSDDALPRSEARRRLGLAEKGNICLISFGGGGNPHYAEVETWALQLARRFRRWTFAVATPPLLEKPPTCRAFKNAVRIHHYPMAECFDAFDLAVSATGSSSYELAHFGLPSILVPDTSSLNTEDFKAKANRILGGSGGSVVGYGNGEALIDAFSALTSDKRRAEAANSLLERALPNGAAGAVDLMLDVMLNRRGESAAHRDAP
jgi:UDP-N-acetylglucosamine--N-acetylmuramyl-(pentapeptide) pyrophosphoryl-undecaprenol N-acetylglucosamine transferase